jgi:hypothetical protein
LTTDLLGHALAYAEAGWPVFPLRPGTKRPATPNHNAHRCTGTDRRCRNGHTGWEPRATTDPHRIETAWRQHPYGIGIACGPAGLVVIDLDTAKAGQAANGADTLAQLEHKHQPVPATWTTGTPSGGRHLYYLQPDDITLGNTAGRLGPGIDTRGHGGYVVAPPTTTPDGRYWLVDDHPPVPLPGWLTELLSRTQRPPDSRQSSSAGERRPRRVDGLNRYLTAAVGDEMRQLVAAPVGQRNHQLFKASIALGQLVGAQLLTAEQAYGHLFEAAHAHIVAGAYSATQARQTINSGLHRGMREPRQLPGHLTGRAVSGQSS